MFDYIQKHYGVFFWLCWGILAVIGVLVGVMGWPDWVLALLYLPLNLISWPVAIEFFHDERELWKTQRRTVPNLVWRMAYGLPVATALPALLWLFEL